MLRLGLAAAGKQDQAPHAVFDRELVNDRIASAAPGAARSGKYET